LSITESMVVFFFFSSRRRHTSFSRDWSSDVCSSDLPDETPETEDLQEPSTEKDPGEEPRAPEDEGEQEPSHQAVGLGVVEGSPRSEERRVGKEGRSRWSAGRAKRERESAGRLARARS